MIRMYAMSNFLQAYRKKIEEIEHKSTDVYVCYPFLDVCSAGYVGTEYGRPRTD